VTDYGLDNRNSVLPLCQSELALGVHLATWPMDARDILRRKYSQDMKLTTQIHILSAWGVCAFMTMLLLVGIICSALSEVAS